MTLFKDNAAVKIGVMSVPATHVVDLMTCKKCHICAAVCPAGIIRAEEEARFLADRIPLCIHCGQCMAACPTRSIFIEGLSYERDFFELPQRKESWEEAFYSMVSSRRSIRNFQDRPVPRELLEKVVQAITFAPPDFTP